METLNIQILLHFSSKDLEKLLRSILFIDVENRKEKVNFYFADQSEDKKEFLIVQKLIEKATKKVSPNINLILYKQPNYGFGKGHNEEYRTNKEKYENSFIILNPDSILPFDFITNIDMYLSQLEHENWGLLELKQFPSEHPKYFNAQTLETNWVSGAGMIINIAAFENIGMFDENIFMYGEDVDLSMRMRINNYKILHLPKASFTHLTKDTDVSKESEFTRVSKQAAELYLRYKFGKDKDVERYIELIGEHDPHRKSIIKKFGEMKSKLERRSFYKDFVDENQDYTNFRWTL